MITEPQIRNGFSLYREAVVVLAIIILLGIMQFINLNLLPPEQLKTDVAQIIVAIMAAMIIYRCYDVLRSIFGES